jgi:tetratricopeptide (TPR) repeat protein
MAAQGKGRYYNIIEAFLIPDRYILYNIGLIYGNTGKYTQALEFYHQALALNQIFHKLK